MSEVKQITIEHPSFSAVSNEHPSWQSKFYSSACVFAPHILTATEQELETLKDEDLDKVPASKCEVEIATHLKNKVSINMPPECRVN